MERMKIFIACAIGAGIGTMVALSVYQYLWWIGLFVGGLTGYLSYEFKAVINAVCIAWKSVVGWRPNRDVVKSNIKTSMLAFGCFVTVWTMTGLPLLMLMLLLNKTGISANGIVIDILLSVFAFVIVFAVAGCWSSTNWEKDEAIAVFKKMRPVYFHCYLLFFLFPKLLWICTRNIGIFFWKIPSFVKSIVITISKFIKTVFILIHSEMRMLCGVDAGIGVVIGFFFGHVIIGAFAGGVIGLLNYEIVSKRILHLVPKRT